MSPGFATSTGAWDEEAPDVFILGAGFSIAADLSFPDTDTLGARALDKIRQANRLGIDLSILPEQFKHGLFEAWLAQIAEDRPSFSRGKNSAEWSNHSQPVR